jgi:hypothetical protein
VLIGVAAANEAVGEATHGSTPLDHLESPASECVLEERASVKELTPRSRAREVLTEILPPALFVCQRVALRDRCAQYLCRPQSEIDAFRSYGVNKACCIAQKGPIAAAYALINKGTPTEAGNGSCKETDLGSGGPGIAVRNKIADAPAQFS